MVNPTEEEPEDELVQHAVPVVETEAPTQTDIATQSSSGPDPTTPVPSAQPKSAESSLGIPESPTEQVRPAPLNAVPTYPQRSAVVPHIVGYSPKRARADSRTLVTVRYSAPSGPALTAASCRLCGSVVPAQVVTETTIQCEFDVSPRPRVCNLSISLDGATWSTDRAELTLFAGRPFRVFDRIALVSCISGALAAAAFLLLRRRRPKKGVSDAGEDIVPFIPITRFTPGDYGGSRRRT